MTATEARYHLQRTKQKYLLLRLTETLLLSLGVALIAFSICKLISIQQTFTLLLPLTSGFIFFILRCLQLNMLNVKESGVVKYINRHYPQMEESTELLLIEDEELTSLQQLQKLKSIRQFESLSPEIKLPNNLIHALSMLLISVVVCAVIIIFLQKQKVVDSTTLSSDPGKSVPAVNLPASIERASIAIMPPSYTGLEKKDVTNFNIHIPEGTTVQWNLSFTTEVTNPQLIFSGRDSIPLKSENNQYKAERSISTTGFYQVVWKNKDGSKKYSDYFQVEVIRDQPPNIAVENLNQFIELSLTDNHKIELKSILHDDYGLRDAYIIATVSKGSGEAVKFREEKLTFDKPAKIDGKQVKSTRLIDVVKLGLDPGDELYFYVEAVDNKVPGSNRSRTETFFISLQDTAAITTSVDPGSGVDLMPEYFRSQRQIIIDSEKLLREKKKITKENFNSRSNELGYDQKVLRLRYGEFLGEEFESGIGPQAEIPGEEGHDADEDVTKKYGHVHDKENEHNLVEEKKSTKDTHDHTAGKDDKEDPAKAYMHQHDNVDEATFFTQSIRAKLKAAITIMWDAELYLRLYEPEKSLPFQYKALKLLKEISQDSRIYVHRTGFDPPPLKEEKRLTGDLTEIKNSTALHELPNAQNYPGIRIAARYIEQFLDEKKITTTPEIKTILIKAGQELSQIAIMQPGRYLKSLSLLKALTENELDKEDQLNALIEIRSTFWRVLPDAAPSPQASQKTTHALDERFLNNLNALKQQQ